MSTRIAPEARSSAVQSGQSRSLKFAFSVFNSLVFCLDGLDGLDVLGFLIYENYSKWLIGGVNVIF